MSRIIRLTERDLTRIVKRVLIESEEGTKKEEMCKKEMSAEEFTQKAINACTSTNNEYSSDCLKLGTKTMYPKTYNKLKSLNDVGSIGQGTGCVDIEGNGLAFYENYAGWLNFLGVNCGDKIITIPKVSQSVKNFRNHSDYSSGSWLIYGDSIYIYRWGGC